MYFCGTLSSISEILSSSDKWRERQKCLQLISAKLSDTKTKEMITEFQRSSSLWLQSSWTLWSLEIYPSMSTCVLTGNNNAMRDSLTIWFVKEILKLDCVLLLSYERFIQLVLMFCSQCWGGAPSVQNNNKQVKLREKVTGEPLLFYRQGNRTAYPRRPCWTAWCPSWVTWMMFLHGKWFCMLLVQNKFPQRQ